MNAIIEACLGRARVVVATLALLLILGAIGYSAIPKEAEPDITIPFVYVQLIHEGISPEDAERMILRPIEAQLRGLEGLEEMSASGYQGGGNIILEFDPSVDASEALQDAKDAVDLARQDLPQETEEPIVREVTITDYPVVVVSLSGGAPMRTLQALARDLRDEIEGLPQVLSVDIAGDREELVEIILDPLLVESYGLSGADLLPLFQRNNRLVAAGEIDTGQGAFSIKVPGLLETGEDILDMPLKVEEDSVVRVRDIAFMRPTFRAPESLSRIQGERSIGLEVVKRVGENLIRTVEDVRAVVERERQFWPDGVQVTFAQDRSDEIRMMVGDLQNSVVTAVILVMIVCVAALGLRQSLLVGVAIPGAFLVGILVLFGVGLSINHVTMFGLILSVGILVDGAIVTTEYADRKMSEGLHRRDAFALAAKRMAWPIISSTATTLAAFLPLIFWPGFLGAFMQFLPVTLMAVLTASAAMALIFIPTLGALFGKPTVGDPEVMRALAAGETGDPREIKGITGAYVRLLDGLLSHPLKVVLGAVVILVSIQLLYAAQGNGVNFFPETEGDFASLNVHARGNLSVWEKHGLVREVEDRVNDLDGVALVYTRTGSVGFQGNNTAEDVIGQVVLEFEEWHNRPPVKAILAEARARTADLAGVNIEISEQEPGPPVGKPVAVQLESEFPPLLAPVAARIRAWMDNDPDLIQVEDTRSLPGIEWALQVDRAQAAKFGVDVQAVGDAVKLITRGLEVGSYRPDGADDEVDIVLRYPDEYRGIDQLDAVRIETPQGSVPISNFVTRAAEPQVTTVSRIDGTRILSVRADVREGVQATRKNAELRAWLDEQDFDPRVNIVLRGEDEEQRNAQSFLGTAFGLALFLMAAILVTQFNSFYSAFLILTGVIMSTIGVFVGLLITGNPFDIVMTGIGIIALAGIVVNNNIVLIDTFDRLKQTSSSVREAILRTGAQRLRPVFLTTVTTMLGLTPMATGASVDFVNRDFTIGAPFTLWWAPMAQAIIFGLGFATLLTLVFTPSALMIRANFKSWWARKFVKTTPSTPRDAPDPAALPAE